MGIWGIISWPVGFSSREIVRACVRVCVCCCCHMLPIESRKSVRVSGSLEVKLNQVSVAIVFEWQGHSHISGRSWSCFVEQRQNVGTSECQNVSAVGYDSTSSQGGSQGSSGSQISYNILNT